MGDWANGEEEGWKAVFKTTIKTWQRLQNLPPL